jgi:hypothetical protein
MYKSENERIICVQGRHFGLHGTKIAEFSVELLIKQHFYW